jgi:hypothetical protein
MRILECIMNKFLRAAGENDGKPYWVFNHPRLISGKTIKIKKYITGSADFPLYWSGTGL